MIALDTHSGGLRGFCGAPDPGPSLTRSLWLASATGREAEFVVAADGRGTAHLSLPADALLPVPSKLQLDFQDERLERLMWFATEPPLAKNPRWWRRADEQERHELHVAFLQQQAVSPGWWPWGELVAEYNSGARLSSIRLRYAHQGAPWNVSGRVHQAPPPSRCLDAASGALRLCGESPVMSAALTEEQFCTSSLAARASTGGPGRHRVHVDPGELFLHRARLDLTFVRERLQRVDVIVLSERFGVEWQEHGADEVIAEREFLRQWLRAATGADGVRGAWGSIAVFADDRAGNCSVRVDYR